MRPTEINHRRALALHGDNSPQNLELLCLHVPQHGHGVSGPARRGAPALLGAESRVRPRSSGTRPSRARSPGATARWTARSTALTS
jgi:hypothetical protein